jgi:hypothetical protein
MEIEWLDVTDEQRVQARGIVELVEQVTATMPPVRHRAHGRGAGSGASHRASRVRQDLLSALIDAKTRARRCANPGISFVLI